MRHNERPRFRHPTNERNRDIRSAPGPPRNRDAGAVLCTAVIEGLDLQSMGIAAPKLGPEFHLSKELLGYALHGEPGRAALRGLSSAAAWPTLWGRKGALLLATVIFGVFQLSTAWRADYRTLLVIRFLCGAGTGRRAAQPHCTDRGGLRRAAIDYSERGGSRSPNAPGRAIASWIALSSHRRECRLARSVFVRGRHRHRCSLAPGDGLCASRIEVCFREAKGRGAPGRDARKPFSRLCLAPQSRRDPAAVDELLLYDCRDLSPPRWLPVADGGEGLSPSRMPS